MLPHPPKPEHTDQTSEITATPQVSGVGVVVNADDRGSSPRVSKGVVMSVPPAFLSSPSGRGWVRARSLAGGYQDAVGNAGDHALAREASVHINSPQRELWVGRKQENILAREAGDISPSAAPEEQTISNPAISISEARISISKAPISIRKTPILIGKTPISVEICVISVGLEAIKTAAETSTPAILLGKRLKLAEFGIRDELSSVSRLPTRDSRRLLAG